MCQDFVGLLIRFHGFKTSPGKKISHPCKYVTYLGYFKLYVNDSPNKGDEHQSLFQWQISIVCNAKTHDKWPASDSTPWTLTLHLCHTE